MIITVDDSETHRQPIIRLGNTFRFWFEHDGRRLRVAATRRFNMRPGKLRYTISVDGHRIVTSEIRIQNWLPGFIIRLILAAIIFIVFYLFAS